MSRITSGGFPFASDLYGSPTWQWVLEHKPSSYGPRPLEAYLHRPRVELYDLEKDPDEARNLADSPDLASVRDELEKKLEAWQRATRDPWVIKYEHE